MDLQEMFNTARSVYADQIQTFEKAVLSGVCSLIYPEYLRKIKQHPENNEIRLLMPSLKKVQTFLDPKNEFMQGVSSKLIQDLSNARSIKMCLNYPELAIFDIEKFDINILKVLFDINMAESISNLMIKILIEKFKLNDPSQHIAVEDESIEIFNDKSSLEQHFFNEYLYLFNQILYHLLIESNSFLTDERTKITFLEQNIHVVLPKNYVLSVRTRNIPCDIYFTPSLVESPLYKMISLMTNTMIEQQEDGTSILNSGAFNQLYLFENSDVIF